MLINQEIIHQDNTNCLAWNKENIHDILIWFMHDLLWKNNIIKQAKNWEIIIMMQMNVTLIHAANAAIETCKTVCN